MENKNILLSFQLTMPRNFALYDPRQIISAYESLSRLSHLHVIWKLNGKVARVNMISTTTEAVQVFSTCKEKVSAKCLPPSHGMAN